MAENTNLVITAITTVGFPIVMCGAMGWFVVYIVKDLKKSIDQMTVVLTKLSERIDRD